ILYRNVTGVQTCALPILTIFLLSGLGRGIKWLSNTNIVIAILLLFFFLFVGPTTFLMDTFTTTIGSYAQNFISKSFRLSPFDESGDAWIQGWTVCYWEWWIAWSPFVGTFI